MKTTHSKLRRLIRETLMNEGLGDTLKNNYDIVNQDEKFPFGRNRGDVKRTTTYVRKDGGPVPPEDIAIFVAKEKEQAKDAMSALKGQYKHEVSPDGMTLTMRYYRHTAG